MLRVAIEAAELHLSVKQETMQTPSLSWKNGGVDLEAWIAATQSRRNA